MNIDHRALGQHSHPNTLQRDRVVRADVRRRCRRFRLSRLITLRSTHFRGYAVRHEARVIRVGWKDPPAGCRSSPVKLRAAGPVEVRRSGGKQP